MYKLGRMAAAAITGLAMTVVSTPSHAQQQGRTPFTWASSGTRTCTNMMCTQQRLDLGLTGFGADFFGTNLGSVGATWDPAAPSPTNMTGALRTPGFFRGFSISALGMGASYSFDAALNGTVQGGFTLAVTDGGRTLVGSRNNSPLVRSPFSLLVNVTGTDVQNIVWEYSGSAYLADNTDFTWTGSNGRTYDVGAYAGTFQNVGVVPEPSTYALLATGLAGLSLVARRRRKV